MIEVDTDVILYSGDALTVLPQLERDSINCIVTSPPYLDARSDYSHIANPELYAEWLSQIAEELVRVATPSAPFILNIGRIFRNNCESGWWLLAHEAVRQYWLWLDTMIWIKPNANPIHGPILANSHEYVFIYGQKMAKTKLFPDAIRTDYDEATLARMTRRYRNQGGVKGEHRNQNGRKANELGARARSFYIAYIGGQKGNTHPAPMPEALAETLILLGSQPGDTILDPFSGSGTTAAVARKHNRPSVSIELDEQYCQMIVERLQQQSLLM